MGELSDYITAIAWLTDDRLAACSAAGEVALLTGESGVEWLQGKTGRSLNCLAVSQDGQFLAVGGQDGTIIIWRIDNTTELVTLLEYPSVWVDRLLWHPTRNQLAFGLGRYAQVWDADSNEIITTLNFESSSVLDLAWHPTGEWLAVCGHRGARVWNAMDWDDDPQVLEIPSASVAIAWSPDGCYLADGNLDSTLTVLEWARPEQPWIMQGFPGKVRQLAWSQLTTSTDAPLLATCSSDSVIVWARDTDESVGWANRILEAHEGIVQAIAFQPNSFLLASTATDGQICLWQNAEELVEILEGAPSGFSCLSWHPTGGLLAAGGNNGEVIITSMVRL